MARRLSANIDGDYFVDDTCREVAPNTFREESGHSVVFCQPTGQEVYLANLAIVACPTGSIHTDKQIDKKAVAREFPIPVAENVYYNGFNSPKSYGAKSYLVVTQEGN